MKTLTNERIAEIAKEFRIDPAALLAIKEVESGGSGFLPNGKPKILFEGHIFYRLLSKVVNNVRLNQLKNEFPQVVYPVWDRKKYKGGILEYTRLEQAMRIDKKLALQSASWGLFQIMGMNYAMCGCSNVEEFVDKMEESEEEQLKLTIKFLFKQGLVKFLNTKHWAYFARAYNGPGYAQNKYDVKLMNAYNKYKSE
jgi:conserved hypothetical protein|nr:MAG TPA: N acetylmuramidase [Caudoviricetes sp.]